VEDRPAGPLCLRTFMALKIATVCLVPDAIFRFCARALTSGDGRRASAWWVYLPLKPLVTYTHLEHSYQIRRGPLPNGGNPHNHVMAASHRGHQTPLGACRAEGTHARLSN
jgi:hypothetical protein